MFKTYVIPSVIEVNQLELNQVAPDLINGIRIFDEDNIGYLVGTLALSEGMCPQANSPDDRDYKLLAKSALLLASQDGNAPMCVTTGFPRVTYQIYRSKAISFFQANHRIKYDANVFSDKGIIEKEVSVTKAFAIPELMGSDIFLRNTSIDKIGSYFLISLGYGTCEAGLSTESGIVERTHISIPGIRYAVLNAARELMKDYNIGLKPENQFDYGFRQGRIVINRENISLVELRRKHLQHYYLQVISPMLAKNFTDADFSRASTMYIVGGGAYYEDLVSMFQEEFGKIMPVKVLPEPTLAAAKGYAIYSKLQSENMNVLPVGIDIGNANTVVAILGEDTIGRFM
jgi:hypothetical protein